MRTIIAQLLFFTPEDMYLEYLWLVLLILALYLLMCYMKQYLRSVLLAFSLPGPVPLPLLGNVLMLNDNKRLEYIGTYCSDIYGTILRCWISFAPFFFILDPKHIQVLLSSNRHVHKNVFYTFMHNFLGEGLITSSGNRWKSHRKLMSSLFHVNILQTYVETFAKTSEVLVKRLEGRKNVKITEFINDFVLDVLHQAVLGIPLDVNKENSPFRRGEVMVSYRVTRPWFMLDTFFKLTSLAENELRQKYKLQDYIKHVLEKKKKQNHGNRSCSCFLEMLMEIEQNNEDFTEEDVLKEACTLMLAGQDSTGAAIAFSLYFLAKYQDIQEKVFNEQCQIFGNSGRELTIFDLEQMKYLGQCIKETMRLCPSVPIIARKIDEDVTLGTHTFPAGCNIFLSPFMTHRLPSYFPNPLKYDPDRFSPENLKNIHSYAYLPFSLGPRNCIGYKFAFLQMKSVISLVLRHYHIELIEGNEKLNLIYRVTLRAKGGVWISLTERKNSAKQPK